MHELIIAILSSFLRLKGSRVDAINITYSPLLGGLSKAILYQFEFNKKIYVLRLTPQNADLKTRKHQINLALYASNLEIGPFIHYIDPEYRAIIMDFIPGHTVLPEDFNNQNNLKEFAQVLRKLHQSYGEIPIACSPFDRFNDFVKKGVDQKLIFPSRLIEAQLAMNAIERAFASKNIALVPSHLDLQPLNILFLKNRFFIIDWVNGGKSNPYFDLSTFAFFNNLSNNQIHILLTHYFERNPTQSENDYFTIAQPVRLFVIASAFLLWQPNNTEQCNLDVALENAIAFHTWQTNKDLLNLPPWQIGLIALKAGLNLIESQDFKAAIRNII